MTDKALHDRLKQLVPRLADHLIQLPQNLWPQSIVAMIKMEPRQLQANPGSDAVKVVPTSNRIVDCSNNRLILRFPDDLAISEWFQSRIPSIRFFKGRQQWECALNLIHAEIFHEGCEKYKFAYTKGSKEAIVSMLDNAAWQATASYAPAAAFQLRVPCGVVPRPYQLAGIEYLTRVKQVLLADDMGIGKTFQALISAVELSALPLLVICPASLKYQWQNEIAKAYPNLSVHVCDGRKNQGLVVLSSDVVIINYELLAAGWEDQKKKLINLSEVGLQLIRREWKAIIADESHRIMNPKAQCTIAACRIADAQDVKVRFALTGTPADDRPTKLIGQLQFIDKMKEFGSAWKFRERYSGARIAEGRNGKKFVKEAKKAKHHKELGSRLRAVCMIRRTKAQVMPELPELQRTVVPVDITNRATYDKAEKDVVAFVKQLAYEDRKFRDSVAHLPEHEQKILIEEFANSKERRAKRAEVLVRFNVLMKLASEGKRKAALEWIQDFAETEKRLIVFAFYQETQQYLFEQSKRTAFHIFGKDNAKARTEAMRQFTETDDSEIYCSVKAAGEGLNLQAASDELFPEICVASGPLNQCEARAHRDGQKNCVNATYLVALNSLDWDTYEVITEKRATSAAIFDDSDLDENLEKLIKKLLARHKV